MSNMLTSSIILISVIEQTSVAGAVVKLDDSILREAYEVAEYVIEEILPYAVVIIIVFVIFIVMVEFILRLFMSRGAQTQPRWARSKPATLRVRMFALDTLQSRQ